MNVHFNPLIMKTFIIKLITCESFITKNVTLLRKEC